MSEAYTNVPGQRLDIPDPTVSLSGTMMGGASYKVLGTIMQNAPPRRPDRLHRNRRPLLDAGGHPHGHQHARWAGRHLRSRVHWRIAVRGQLHR